MHAYVCRYMIKTMSKEEADSLLRILPTYMAYVHAHPDTFLTRFLGMYTVSAAPKRITQATQTSPRHMTHVNMTSEITHTTNAAATAGILTAQPSATFVVTTNVFYTNSGARSTTPFTARYDLKGSHVGRRTRKSSNDVLPATAVLKDMDLAESGRKLRIGRR